MCGAEKPCGDAMRRRLRLSFPPSSDRCARFSVVLSLSELVLCVSTVRFRKPSRLTYAMTPATTRSATRTRTVRRKGLIWISRAQYAHARLRLPAFCHERLDGALLPGELKTRRQLGPERRQRCDESRRRRGAGKSQRDAQLRGDGLLRPGEESFAGPFPLAGGHRGTEGLADAALDGIFNGKLDERPDLEDFAIASATGSRSTSNSRMHRGPRASSTSRFSCAMAAHCGAWSRRNQNGRRAGSN